MVLARAIAKFSNSSIGESYKHLMEMVTEAIEGWLEVANEKDI